MATKASETVEAGESREESTDGPLMDSTSATFKKLLQKAKERGYVTYDELNQVLPPDQMSSEQIEDHMARISEMGITVIESEEPDDPAPEAEETPQRPAGNLDDDDIGRTDDPVRMYLREMGSVELLSREGEIAIAKRIEAGREKMIGGVCENPLTIKALLSWRQALLDGHILLRDIIDLDATYGGGPDESALTGESDDDGDDPEAKNDNAKTPAAVAVANAPAAVAVANAPAAVAVNGAAEPKAAPNGQSPDGESAAGESAAGESETGKAAEGT